jgi:hypothetical protein
MKAGAKASNGPLETAPADMARGGHPEAAGHNIEGFPLPLPQTVGVLPR